MTQNTRTQALTDAGVSIWLDDLSRERLASGDLQRLIDTVNVAGVTTNPSIFQAAIAGTSAYDEDIARLAAEGRDAEGIVEVLTTDDVRAACDLFSDLHAATDGTDGRVSIEVDPRLARDTAATIEQAVRLHELVGRENVMIKIPATAEGLPAITEVIGRGISVNVTLIFSVERYRAVVDAYLAGLERARDAGIDLAGIRSVASFFVSRVDTEVDSRLGAIGGPAAQLVGQAAVANARVAFGEFLDAFATERFHELEAAGAAPQRPLWASTGVKNPDYSDTLYVDSLVARPSVNTMPEKTLRAVADHGQPGAPLDAATAQQAAAVLERIAGAGVDLAEVCEELERDGVAKFEKAWTELLETVGAAARDARP